MASLLARQGALCARSTRHLVTSAVVKSSKAEVAPGYKKIKQLQEKFLMPDGKPIHLKGGALDYYLYTGTAGMSVVTLVVIFASFYQLIFPSSGK